MALIKAPAANTLTLDPGLEVIDNSIQLAVGSGGWNANSLEMAVLPPLPWGNSKNAGSTVVINDEQIQKIVPTLKFNFWLLAPPDWDGVFLNGITFYYKLRVLESTGLDEVSLFIEDGSVLYKINHEADGTLTIVGVSSPTHDFSKYPWSEIFVTFDGTTVKTSIWNPVTLKFDSFSDVVAGSATATNRLLFGTTSPFGGANNSVWDFLRWKTGIAEASPFKTTSPVAEWAAPVTINANIDQLDWAEVGDLKHQYDIGAGYNGSWLTYAQLLSALINTTPGSLKLKTQFNSDGDTPASIDLDGTQSVIGPENIVLIRDTRRHAH